MQRNNCKIGIKSNENSNSKHMAAIYQMTVSEPSTFKKQVYTMRGEPTPLESKTEPDEKNLTQGAHQK